MLKRKTSVVLLERIPKLGQMGQVVNVANGYARNYLLPKKKALRATKDNLAYFDEQKAHLQADDLKKKSDAQYVSKTMEGLEVIVIRQASEMGHLYGSVRNKDVSEAIKAQGFTVDKSQVNIANPIKILGEHTVEVLLHPEVSVEVLVVVAKTLEEAKNRHNKQEESTEPSENDISQEPVQQTE